VEIIEHGGWMRIWRLMMRWETMANAGADWAIGTEISTPRTADSEAGEISDTCGEEWRPANERCEVKRRIHRRTTKEEV
jgi:hypothetical protein